MLIKSLNDEITLPNDDKVQIDGKNGTIKQVLIGCCLNVLQDDQNMSSEKKMQLAEAARAIYLADTDVELPIEVVTEIKSRSAKMHPIGIHWALKNAVDPKVFKV